MHKSSQIIVISIVLLVGSSAVLGSCCPFDPPIVQPPPAITPTPEPPIEQIETLIYTVEAGDTLDAIAEENGISLDDLMSINNLTDPDQIQVGQELLIPVR